MTNTALHIHTIENSLSDGSLTYDVLLRHTGTGDALKFCCCDEKSARGFVADLLAAVEKHTVSTTEVR